jgi:hypothetical protein
MIPNCFEKDMITASKDSINTNQNKTFLINSEIVKNITEQYKEILKQKFYFSPESNSELVNKFTEQLKQLEAKHLEEILEFSIYESLEREEGIFHNFSIIVSPYIGNISMKLSEEESPVNLARTYAFQTPQSMNLLHKLAPALESTNKRIGVWFNADNKVEVWGFTATTLWAYCCIKIRTLSPGQLLILLPDFPYKKILMSLSRIDYIRSDFSLRQIYPDSELKHNFLMKTINKMRKHAHGGILLIIPDKDSADDILEKSLENNISFKPNFIFEEIKEAVNLLERNERNEVPYNYVNLLGQLTAIDGATIITKDFDVIAFGVKIKQNPSNEFKILVEEPFENGKDIKVKTGKRHQSAAEFVFDQRDKNAFAIVASQDGIVSIMFWDANRTWFNEKEEAKKGAVIMLRNAEYLYFGTEVDLI